MNKKYFSGFLLGDTYYCIGGIDSNGKAMNQFVEIDLHTMYWKDVRYPKSIDYSKKKEFKKYPNIDSNGQLEHLYGHKICVVTYKRTFLALD